MDAGRLAFLRDSLDAYLLRCADRIGYDPRAVRSLALELISNYHDDIAIQFGGVPERVARHLRNAGNAAQDNQPPVVVRELEAALAIAARLPAEQGSRSVTGDEDQS